MLVSTMYVIITEQNYYTNATPTTITANATSAITSSTTTITTTTTQT